MNQHLVKSLLNLLNMPTESSETNNIRNEKGTTNKTKVIWRP